MTTIIGATTNYHNPIGAGEALTPLAFNQRFANLDAAIDAVSAVGTTVTVTLGEGVGIRDAGYVRESDGQGYLLDNNDATPDVGAVRGFWTATEISGQPGTLQISGVLDGFSGLTAGAPVYADDTAGAITQTRPTPTLDGVQVVVVELGIAISATEIYVNPRSVEYMKRAVLDDDETVTITHQTDPAGRLREVWAYVSESSGVTALIEYASGNQDDDYALRNEIVSSYGADQCTGGTASASAASAPASLAFANDGNGPSNSWVGGGPPAWLKYDFGVGVTRTIRRYTLIQQSGFANRAPQDWTFEGSNDDSNWDVLDTVTGETGWAGTRTFDFANATAYRYYRINVSANNGDASFVSIGEMEMKEAATTTTDADELAQTFTLSAEETIASVQVYLRKVGSPTGTLTCTIETLNVASPAGNPTGTLVDANATATVAEISLSTSYAMVEFDFTDFTLSAGNYAIVLNTDRVVVDSAADYIEWGYDSSSPGYADGQMKRVISASWTDIGGDAIFSINEPGVTITSRLSVDWWSSTHADIVNRYGDGSGSNLNTQTTFKCVAAAGFEDVTVVVELP